MNLVDSSSQVWSVGVNSIGEITTTAVSGSGVAFVLINDSTVATTWSLSVSTTGVLMLVASAYSSGAVYSYPLASPSSVIWTLTVLNGYPTTQLLAATTIIGGPFEDAGGNVLSNGTLIFLLDHDAVVSAAGVLVCAGLGAIVNLNVNGSISTNPSFAIWPNDQLSPSGTEYYVWAYTSTNQLAWGPVNVQVLSTPSPYNINAWLPAVGE